MANVAKIDENTRAALTAVSNADADVIVPLYADPTTHRLLVDVVSGGTTTVDAGTTTGVPYGDPATVTNSGTTTNAVFDFEIPEGAPGAAGATGPKPTINDTSVTSNDIGTGAKTFSVTSATNSWVVGDWLIISETATPTNFMTGNITAYTGPSVTVNVVATGGSGTGITAWTLALSGVRGADGAGAGTVTTVSVVSANGVSGTVANATSTPAITLALGAITPSSVATTGRVSYDDADWTGGNVIYVPLAKTGKTQTEILNEAIVAATAGDTLILGSGTYTVTSTITVGKSVFIRGQGGTATTITGSGAVDTFTITSSDVRIADLKIVNTGAVTAGITVNRNLTNIVSRNVIIASSGTGFHYGYYIDGSSVNILNGQCIVSSSNDACYGLYLFNDSSTTANATINIIDTVFTVTQATNKTSEGIYIYNNNDTNTITVNIYNSDLHATSATGTSDVGLDVASATTNTITVNAHNTTLSGGDYDVRVTNPNIVNLYGCVLENGTTSVVTGGLLNKLGANVGEKLLFNLTPTVGTFASGKLYHDADWQTLSYETGRDLTLQIGEEEWRRVYNNTGSTIANGTAVYTTGVYNGGLPYTATIGLADASDSAKWQVLGLTTQEILTGNYGMVTVRGHVNGCNTNAWTAGDILYLSDVTPGALTNALPSAGNYKVRVGRVIYKDASVGVINVRLLSQGKLGDLANVTAPSPTLDQVLTFNGVEWVNGNKATSSASAGIDFFYATPVIKSRTSPTGLTSDGVTGNGIQINSLSKTPVTTAEQTQAVAVNADTRTGAAWLYNTALDRTAIDSGIWNFTTYASVSNTTGTHSITRGIYQVVPGTGTLTITGTNANDRVATITDAQYDGTYFAANASNLVASYIQATSGTDKGIYQISVMADGAKKIATIRTATGYTNEAGVTYNIWNKLFSATSGNLTSTSIIQYDTTTSQPAFTIAATDKLGSILYCTSTASRTITVAYDGTTRNTHVTTPLITLHNNLAGLQGGDATNRWHLTAAEGTVTGSGGLVRATSPVLTTPNIGSATGSVSGNAGTVTTAAETGDTSCSIAFVTDVSGSLPLKTNTNLTFNASTGVLTSASAVLTTADINGGTFDNATIGASTASTIVGTTITANTGLMPDANDGAYIGQAGTAFSDLFLAEGGVINWDSGDATLTQTGNTLALDGADLSLTAGFNLNLTANSQIKLVLPTTDAQCSGHTTASFVAGETIAAAQIVFFKSDGKWWITDSDAVATCKGLLGVALTGGNANDTITVALPNSFIHFDAWGWTAGDVLYIGDATAGTLQNAIPTGADCIIRVGGFAIDADTIYWNPSSDSQSAVA